MSRPSRAAFAACAFIIATIVAGCGGAAADSVAPSGNNAAAAIAITPSAPAVALGSQLALQAQVQDANGQIVSGATVFWSSSDTTVVAVTSAGVVTGKNVGTAQVAASAGGESAVVPVTVSPVQVASLAVAPTTATVAIGGTVALQAVAYDASGAQLSGRAVTWATSAPQVATVDASGNVTAVTAGTAIVTGTCEGKTASATITVTVIPVAAVTVTPGSATLTVGQTASLSATATDANGNVLSGRAITWSSANSAIATVSTLGLVKAIGAGTTTIAATSEGKSGTAQVIVTAAAPPVASVAVNPDSANISVGSTVTLSATVRDANGGTLSGRTVTWSSSAATIATVSSSGVVTAVANGTATITATSEGKGGTAKIVVAPGAQSGGVASVQITPAAVALRSNHSKTLTAQALDANGHPLPPAGVTFTWISSNPALVSVTSTGATTATVLTHGFGTGTATISATYQGVFGTSTITVGN
jgi:uncharacterized protein YjdB